MVSAKKIREKAEGLEARSEASSLLSELVLTEDDDELKGFRRAHIGLESTFELPNLREARELLDVLGLAVAGEDPELWELVHDAWTAIYEDESGRPPSSSPVAAPPEPEVAKPQPQPEPLSAPVPAPAPAAVVAPPPSVSPPTQTAPESQGPRSVSPWARSGQAPPPSQPAPSPEPARTQNVQETAGIGAISPLAALAPFQQGNKKQEGGPSFDKVEGLAAPPSAVEELEPLPDGSVGETAALGAVSPLAAMMPFAKKAEPPSSPKPPPPPKKQVKTMIGGTRLTPPAAQVPVPPPPVELTIEQYASLYATCGVYPDRASGAYAGYNLTTAEARAQLDEHWRARFSSEPDLQERYTRLVAEYTAWHKNNPS